MQEQNPLNLYCLEGDETNLLCFPNQRTIQIFYGLYSQVAASQGFLLLQRVFWCLIKLLLLLAFVSTEKWEVFTESLDQQKMLLIGGWQDGRARHHN